MFLFVIILLITVLICAVLWAYRRGRIVPATGASWLAYALYEIWMQQTCTGECNIRVDLLLIYPLLLVLSLLTLFVLVRRYGRRRKADKS